MGTTAGTRVEIDPKRQAEIVSPLFDFSSKCQAGDVLSAPTVTVTVWSGIDANPSAVYGGSAPIAGQVVSPVLQAGIVGVLYLVAVKVIASLSGTLELDGILAVIPQGL